MLRITRIIQILSVMTAIFIVVCLSGCEGGGSGILRGQVVDGLGYPLGGEAVQITLSGIPAVTEPNPWGYFTIYAPVGEYEMTISMNNPSAGFKIIKKENVTVGKGSKNLGTFTLLDVQNMAAWEAYRERDYVRAYGLFLEQASKARTAQYEYLPSLRYSGGDITQNPILLQGRLSAENGLGWTTARGFHLLDEAKTHFKASLSGGYNNFDAKVGLAGIFMSEGDIETALKYLNEVIEEPGYYDSRQFHDSITEVDLIAVRSLLEFLTGYERKSAESALSIKSTLATEGNSASNEVITLLREFRPVPVEPGGKPK